MHLVTHRTLFHPTSRETTMQLFRLLIAAACALGTLPALAQTTVKDPWVRGTVAQQKATGASMKMRALPKGLDLPAGKTVELKPGGYHVMLMDLKAPLKAGESVDISLVVEGKDGKKETIALKAPVKELGAAGGHGQHKH